MNELQQKMFDELGDRSLFQKVAKHGMDYVENVWERKVFPTEEALQDLAAFEEPLPAEPGDPHAIVDILNTYGAPATLAQIGGRYFGFVNGSIIPAGLAAKHLAGFWDQNSAMQVMSPIASKLEMVVQNWLIDLFGFPEGTVAGFVSGTSMANFCALAAARYKILKKKDWDITKQGMVNAPKIRVVTGKQAHASMLKAISLIGLGTGNIEWVDVDAQGRIIPEKVPQLDSNTILILQAGEVNSGAFDDFSKICRKARASGVWTHVDGAFGLWAGATNRLRHLTADFEWANSWAVDAHKTLNAPYDSGIIFCSDPESLTSSIHTSGAYLMDGEERDGMHYTPEMSRRARIIELWATLKYLGKTGIDELVFGLHERAVQFATLIVKSGHFMVLNDVVFNQVIVQCATDEQTAHVIRRVQQQRVCWVGGSVWNERKIIRVSVCAWTTTEADVIRAVDSFNEAVHALT